MDHHQVIFKSSSSSSHIHHQVIFIKSRSLLDHHRNWIITGSLSKLDHHWIIIKARSSLDHHQSWIIIKAISSLDHHYYSVISIKWCYLSILLVTGSSTEPTLFHAGCRPSLHVGLLLALISSPKLEWTAQHLYLIM